MRGVSNKHCLLTFFINIVTIVVAMLKQGLNTCWFVGPLCGDTRFSSGFGYIVAWSQFMSSSLMFEGELYGFFECLHVIGVVESLRIAY